ncbi:MAG: arginine--tRNA ligase, partial [Deltaproteobacteria bacterium]|nr:arginine--tRNA ligase [Deltaproteobacteria bacterium]
EEGSEYGKTDLGRGMRVHVEFVSSNPTGPLHVGHGRGAAVGDSVANILSFCGYDVQREYYINDSGRQIATLGRSVYLRYRQLEGERVVFPEDCYQGDYIQKIAEWIKRHKKEDISSLSETDAIMYCAQFAAKEILAQIRSDLYDFGVTFNRWFSEQSLYDSGKVEAVISKGQADNIIYKKDGALWFKTSAYGDEKDRVVVRSNGDTTYFASDIAYHQDKYDRGFDRVIDVWGADHHGYIPRMRAAIEAYGRSKDQFHVILVQLVNLLRAGEPVAMSTRRGEYVTLRQVVDEVGKDAARFIFLTRHHESPLDFDLEVAKQKTNENPVYYVQYVHARISSIIRKAKERGKDTIKCNDETLSLLKATEEIQLIKTLSRYPETVETSATLMEPHRIPFYLMELASKFHAYYNKHRVLGNSDDLTAARLCLVEAVQKVIRNGLVLLSVSAPERM